VFGFRPAYRVYPPVRFQDVQVGHDFRLFEDGTTFRKKQDAHFNLATFVNEFTGAEWGSNVFPFNADGELFVYPVERVEERSE